MSKTVIDVPDALFSLTPDSRLGLTLGGAVTFPLSEKVGLQIGGAYVQKGHTFDAGPFGKADAALDYLEVAALAKPSFPLTLMEGRESSFHLLLGPAFGFQLRCELSVDGETVEDGCSGADAISSTDFGVAGGLGVQVGRFSLDLTYTLGLANVADPETDEYGDTSAKNRVFSIQAGFSFPVGS